jgi:hypothetical protein
MYRMYSTVHSNMYCTSSLFVFSKKVPRLSRARGDRVVITPQLSARGTRRAGPSIIAIMQ